MSNHFQAYSKTDDSLRCCLIRPRSLNRKCTPSKVSCGPDRAKVEDRTRQSAAPANASAAVDVRRKGRPERKRLGAEAFIESTACSSLVSTTIANAATERPAPRRRRAATGKPTDEGWPGLHRIETACRQSRQTERRPP